MRPRPVVDGEQLHDGVFFVGDFSRTLFTVENFDNAKVSIVDEVITVGFADRVLLVVGDEHSVEWWDRAEETEE